MVKPLLVFVLALLHRSAQSVIVAVITTLMLVALRGVAAQATPASERRAEPPQSVRLYVFDCGTLHIPDIERFHLKKEEVVTTDLSVACFLVVHPKGTLLWDAGAVPDNAWIPTGSEVRHHLVLPQGGERDLTLRKPLAAQLAALGYSSADITYLALSHYHFDHTANANALASPTWLVRRPARPMIVPYRPPP